MQALNLKLNPVPNLGKMICLFVYKCTRTFINSYHHSHKLYGQLCFPEINRDQSTCSDFGILLWKTSWVCYTKYIPQITYRVEMKQGERICPHSWSVHCNFVRDGKRSERGGRAPPHPHQQRLIFHHDGMYVRNRQLPVCVFSVDMTIRTVEVQLTSCMLSDSVWSVYTIISRLFIPPL